MQSSARRDESIATVLPDPEAEVCVRHRCEETEGLHAIEPHRSEYEKRVLCPEHGFDYLEEIAR